MTIRDRRSGRERRSNDRFKSRIEVEWEGLIGRKPGMISDLSTLGCFVLCSGEVSDGEKVRIFFPLLSGRKMLSGRKIEFWGEVVNHFYEIGFAMKFTELSDAQKEFLEVYVDILRED